MKVTNKEEFYNDLKKFYDAGFLREIYVDEANCICNVCNQAYVCFPYLRVDNNHQIGYLFSSKDLPMFVSNPTYLYQLLTQKDRSFATKCGYIFNDKLFSTFVNWKKQTDISGPSKLVDLGLEEELMKSVKSK